jgi:2-iminobutanoate/2-iminopropanoate deaminase
MRTLLSMVSILILALVVGGCTAPAPSGVKTVVVSGAPKAAGPYSQGIVANGMLFTAGILPRDPVTGNLVTGDMTVQAQRVFDSLEAILNGAGCSYKDVVKVTVYLADVNDFAKMNEVMAAKFGDSKPARTTIQAGKLPGNAALEIDFVAVVPR